MESCFTRFKDLGMKMKRDIGPNKLKTGAVLLRLSCKKEKYPIFVRHCFIFLHVVQPGSEPFV